MKWAALALILVAASAAMADNIAPQLQRPEPFNYSTFVDGSKDKPVVILMAPPVKLAADPAPAPFSWSWMGYDDLKDHQVYAVVGTQVGSLTDLFGRKDWSLDLGLMTGTSLKNGNLLAGVSVGKSFAIANEVSFYAGAGVKYQQGTNLPVSAGPMFGLSYKSKS